jgi:hypothetical protein
MYQASCAEGRCSVAFARGATCCFCSASAASERALSPNAVAKPQMRRGPMESRSAAATPLATPSSLVHLLPPASRDLERGVLKLLEPSGSQQRVCDQVSVWAGRLPPTPRVRWETAPQSSGWQSPGTSPDNRLQREIQCQSGLHLPPPQEPLSTPGETASKLILAV